jgi:hypothetical protein
MFMGIAIRFLHGNTNIYSCCSWFELEDRGNRNWVGGGETMVGVYGTSVMMFNVYATKLSRFRFQHMLTLSAHSLIHFYLAVQAFRTGGLEMPTIVWQSSACANCQHHELPHRSVSVAGHRMGLPGAVMGYPHEHGSKDFHRPFIQDGDEEDLRESSEYQTSGFNSPRQSAETLGTDFHHDDVV